MRGACLFLKAVGFGGSLLKRSGYDFKAPEKMIGKSGKIFGVAVSKTLPQVGAGIAEAGKRPFNRTVFYP